MQLHWYFCDELFGCRYNGTFVMSGLESKFKSQSSKYYFSSSGLKRIWKHAKIKVRQDALFLKSKGLERFWDTFERCLSFQKSFRPFSGLNSYFLELYRFPRSIQKSFPGAKTTLIVFFILPSIPRNFYGIFWSSEIFRSLNSNSRFSRIILIPKINDS